MLQIVDVFAAVAWPADCRRLRAIGEQLGWTLLSDTAGGADFATPYDYSGDLDNGGRVAIAKLNRVVQLIVVQQRYADIERGEERLGHL